MRLSEFWRAVAEEFGLDYGRALVRDLVLDGLDDHTAEQALAEGRDVRDIWLALCRSMDVPANRWYGVGGMHRSG